MTFYPEGSEPAQPVPRLPAAGWLADPSEIQLERYWDGNRWTGRTRDRVTKLENSAPASALYASYSTDNYVGGPRDWSPPTRKRFRGWRVLGYGVLLTLLVAVVFQYLDRSGEHSPLAAPLDAIVPAQPADSSPDLPNPPTSPITPADIDYPVFGSTELVTYLEAGMVAQQPTLDVSSWAAQMSTDAIGEALLEAGTQNPYLYVSGWEMMQQGERVEVRPAYIYDEAEAERRRSQTAQAVANGLAAVGVRTDMSDEEKVTLIHDYIVDIADYDEGAFDAIENGEDSPRVHQSQEAYGILVMGTAVCNGYAMAFSAMAEQVGLETVTVTGSDFAGETGGSHTWNKVRVDGQWLLVDSTWNDPIGWDGAPLRDYLMIEDDDPILDTRHIGDDWVVSENLGRYSS